MGKLEGKIAVITGGSTGIGFATAQSFVAEGAYVFITGRRQSELDTAVKQLGKNVAAVQGDISKLADLDRLFALVKEQKGRIDVLLANPGAGVIGPLARTTEEQFDHTFDINAKGTFFTVQKALPLMPDGSCVVITGSLLSIKAAPGLGTLAASKAALRSFVRTWALELKERKIRVNIIHPGAVITPGLRTELGYTDEQIAQVEVRTAALAPLGRTAAPDEISKAILFLASDDSSYVTGIELFVDGGWTQI